MKRSAAGFLANMASVGIASLVLSGSHAAEPGLKNPAGTYEVRICRTACLTTGDEGVLVKGYLVLFANPLQKHDLARVPSASTRLDRNGLPNACFLLKKLPGRTYTGYAGIDDSGFTIWSIEGDELQVSLYRSPDAGYRASMRATTKHFEGTGKSWGVGAAAPREANTDYVLFRRTGESDIKRCEPTAKDSSAK